MLEQNRLTVQMTTMAPIYLLPLIEIYCSPVIENCPHLAKGGGTIKVIETLESLGLIRGVNGVVHSKDDHGLRVTEKGREYVRAVLGTPMPKQRWIVTYEATQEDEQ